LQLQFESQDKPLDFSSRSAADISSVKYQSSESLTVNWKVYKPFHGEHLATHQSDRSSPHLCDVTSNGGRSTHGSDDNKIKYNFNSNCNSQVDTKNVINDSDSKDGKFACENERISRRPVIGDTDTARLPTIRNCHDVTRGGNDTTTSLDSHSDNEGKTSSESRPKLFRPPLTTHAHLSVSPNNKYEQLREFSKFEGKHSVERLTMKRSLQTERKCTAEKEYIYDNQGSTSRIRKSQSGYIGLRQRPLSRYAQLEAGRLTDNLLRLPSITDGPTIEFSPYRRDFSSGFDTREMSSSRLASSIIAGESSSGGSTGGSVNVFSTLNSSNARAPSRITPDERKDDTYWERRRKNNEAAKKSRDARRAKEDHSAIRAAILERKNLQLLVEMGEMKQEMFKLRRLLNEKS